MYFIHFKDISYQIFIYFTSFYYDVTLDKKTFTELKFTRKKWYKDEFDVGRNYEKRANTIYIYIYNKNCDRQIINYNQNRGKLSADPITS